MSDRDNITLPREVIVQAVRVLSKFYDTWPRERNEAIIALRTALAAPDEIEALRRDAERLREALAWAYNLRHLRGHSDPVVIPERFAPFIEAALRREDKT